MLNRKLSWLALTATVVLAATIAPVEARTDTGDGAGLAVAVTPTADGRGLVWGGAVDGVVAFDAGDHPTPVTWDLTGLDAAAYRTDLVRVEVVGVDGPGQVTVETDAAHGRRALVVDRASAVADDDTAMVLQVGRRAEQRWTADRPGPHRVHLRASIPLADGGVASTPAPAPVPGAAAAPGAVASGRAASTGAARSAQAGPPIVIADGHVDIGPRVVDGRWRVQIKDDTVTPYVWRDLADVVLHAVDASLIATPDRPAYEFMGPPGTPYHVLPQTQRQGIVWPGWNSQDPSVIEAVPGSVTWRLRGVDGPGRFLIFVTDSFGDTEVYFDSDRPFPQDLEIPRNSHVHGSWAFGAPGEYHLEVEMRATLANGQDVSDTRSLAIAVGDDIDPSTVAPRDPGGAGQEVPPGTDDDGPSVSITTDLDPDGGDADGDGSGDGSGGGPGGGSGGSGGGTLAQTGSAVVALVPWALLLLAAGLALRGAARRLRPAETTS